MKRTWVALAIVVGCLAGCSDDVAEPDEDVAAHASGVVPDPAIADRSRDTAQRIAAMDAVTAPPTPEQREALLLALSDLSQQAFVALPDASPLGYHVAESVYGGRDLQADARWAAIQNVVRLGMTEAIPDLLSALHDRNPGVRNEAAAALWALGSDAGVPVLLKGLEGKAFENETANAHLMRISGQDFGFDTDSGWKNKSAAIERWRAWFESAPRPTLPAAGEDERLDRRVAFLVDMLGQHQFLFMEQARRNLSKLGDLAVAHLERRMFGSPPDGNQQLRAYGIQVLGNVATPRAVTALRRALTTDPDAAVRARAAEVIGRVAGEEGRDELLAALEDADVGVRVAAAEALGRVGGPAVIAALQEGFAAAADGSRMKLVAASSLARLGRSGDGAGAYLLGVLREGELHERADALQLLEEWQGERHGFEAASPGSEQPEAMAAWAEILAGG